MGDVPVVEEDAGAGGSREAGASADARVPDLRDLDACGFEGRLRGRDIRHAQGERAGGQRLKGVVVRLRRHHCECHVPGLVLDPVVVLRRPVRQAEDLAVEALRLADVRDGDPDVIDALHLDHDAYLRCSISWLPSGSLKNAMWQTPVSKTSPSNATPRDSSSLRVSATSATRSAMCAVCGPWNEEPMFVGSIRLTLMF